MKIAISGAHGVGKTNLLEKLELENYTKINEIARELIEIMGNPKNMEPIDKSNFQHNVFIQQLIQEKKAKNFISDRSIYDILAYSEGLYCYDFLEKVANLKKRYDAIFYIPIEFELENDGVRFEGIEFQKEIDNRIVDLLEIFYPDYYTLTGTVEERTEKFYNIVNKLG
ncbi:ATP/GTP-binding protein [Candidatus Vampirococcus lugosii]|uniref:AAA ATPase n=1 Tax=Candidatus Vampirococcus lugosii TaxID=2789015 RepID=A0ABS5QPP2_9BACT|nr:ATP-binding protein [Candidatus Vampirococcus lugosii]MBS8122528.1 AAA ATPase [Candidatus Vampirococcus lugosii]